MNGWPTEEKMTSKLKIDAATDKIKRSRVTKKAKKNTVSPTLDGFMVNELMGNPRVRKNKPDIWVSHPQMGMDKIRASTNVGKYFVDFASSSTVHGFNHLTAPHRHPVERFLAVMVIGAAFASLILLSLNFWERYQHDATIFVLDTDYRNYKVTRPSVLLCPIVRVNESLFPEVFERHGIEDTSEAREFFTFIANATYLNMDETPPYTGADPEKWLTIVWDLKNDAIIENVHDETDGTWIVTERGICKIFNSKVAEYSSYTYWMQKNWTIVPQPATLPETTYKERETGESLKAKYDTVQVFAYHPQEVPEFENQGIYAGQRQVNKLLFVPQEITSSTAVKHLSPSQRKCKILSEGGLTMWPIYTYNMCIMECKYGMILRHCGCHPFFARPMPGIPVCGVVQLRCMAERRSEYTKVKGRVAHDCECYPNCDTSSYEEKANIISSLKIGSPIDAICNVFLEFPTQKVRREVIFGLNDFMAAVGGAAGLFLGASVISFAEFFYWATLRLYWYRINVRREKEAKLKLRQAFRDKFPAK